MVNIMPILTTKHTRMVCSKLWVFSLFGRWVRFLRLDIRIWVSSIISRWILFIFLTPVILVFHLVLPLIIYFIRLHVLTIGFIFLRINLLSKRRVQLNRVGLGPSGGPRNR